MRHIKYCLLVVVISGLCAAGTLMADVWGQYSYAKCEEDVTKCAGATQPGPNGLPLGCVRTGNNCSSNCYKCKTGTTIPVCQYTTSTSCCDYNIMYTVHCGLRNRYQCSGTYPCDCGGIPQQTEESCDMIGCKVYE